MQAQQAASAVEQNKQVVGAMMLSSPPETIVFAVDLHPELRAPGEQLRDKEANTS